MLDVAYEQHGPPGGEAVILLHGFPYDPRAYDEVAPALAGRGLRVVVPYLRGYGPTRFRSAATLRSGQQAALGRDLLDLMDALGLERAALMGYDWGGRAACIAAALEPRRVRCLVTGDGYNIQDIAGSGRPKDPEAEHRLWYQYYFHTRAAATGWRPTAANSAACSGACGRVLALRRGHARQERGLLRQPRLRGRGGPLLPPPLRYVAGDPALEPMERALAAQPPIGVPAISLCGAEDGVGPPSAEDEDAPRFTGPYERRVLGGVGHNIPQEAPDATVRAVLDLIGT